MKDTEVERALRGLEIALEEWHPDTADALIVKMAFQHFVEVFKLATRGE